MIPKETHPAPEALLNVLRPRLGDAVLEVIAEADYGCDAKAHGRALRRIRDEGKVPSPLPWVPREVLSLTRWLEPRAPSDGPNAAEIHVARVFACGVLLISGADPRNQRYVEFAREDETIGRFVASAMTLGSDVEEASLRLLAWRMPSRSSLDRPFFAFGMLVLAMAVGRQSCSEEELGQLVDLVVSEEQAARTHLAAPRRAGRRERWLLDLTEGRSEGVWHALRRYLAAAATQMSSEEVRAKVIDVCARLHGTHAR